MFRSTYSNNHNVASDPPLLHFYDRGFIALVLNHEDKLHKLWHAWAYQVQMPMVKIDEI